MCNLILAATESLQLCFYNNSEWISVRNAYVHPLVFMCTRLYYLVWACIGGELIILVQMYQVLYFILED